MTYAQACNKAARLANSVKDEPIIVAELEAEFGTEWDAARESIADQWSEEGRVRKWIDWSAA